MRVLLTGADGYIGAIMGPKLIEAGHDVVGLDTGFYRRGWLFDDGRDPPHAWSPRTPRRITAADLEGFDAVVHLSELSNDPLGENDPELTMAINHHGSVAPRREGARRPGSGASSTPPPARPTAPAATRCAPRRARSRRRPPTPGARSWSSATSRALTRRALHPDLHAQRHRLRRLARGSASTSSSTTSAASPRRSGEIRMTSDGSPWRPIVHVEDICEAMLCALAADREAVAGESFNVGSDGEQLPDPRDRRDRRRDLPRLRADDRRIGGDTRSYRVSFAKIRRHMPEFETAWDRRARRAPAQGGLRAHRPHRARCSRRSPSPG